VSYIERLADCGVTAWEQSVLGGLVASRAVTETRLFYGSVKIQLLGMATVGEQLE
jgi:hypothetical protein